MLCMFCANRQACFGEVMTDEELENQSILCNYDRYELAEEIDVDDLINESYRRYDIQNQKTAL